MPVDRLRCLEDQQAHLCYLHIYEVENVGKVRSLQARRVYPDLRVVDTGHPVVAISHLVVPHPNLVVVAFEHPMDSGGLGGCAVAPMSPKVVQNFPMVSNDHNRPTGNLMLIEDREQ